MKLLFLTQVLPYPLDAGPKVRAYYTLKHLAQRHAVTLVSFVRGSDTPAACAHLQTVCERVLTVPMPRSWRREAAALGSSLLHGTPLLIARDHVPAMHAALETLVDGTCFDAIHADQLWMAPYALAAQERAARRGCRPMTLLDQHNAVFLVPLRMAEAARSPWRRAMLRREAGLMARYEARICLAFDRVVTVTEQDQAALMSLYPARRPAPPTVIPICVEPGPAPARAKAAAHVLFLGGMHWPPNADGARWFARAMWPIIHARWPTAEFWAVGKQPPPELARPEAAKRGLHAPGYAAELEAHWANARVFVAPLRSGGGMRVKILDAWVRGLPVVSTTVGAEGLAARAGENILIADTPAAFAEAVVRVLSDAALAERLARAGRDTILRHYDWHKTYQLWENVYDAA